MPRHIFGPIQHLSYTSSYLHVIPLCWADDFGISLGTRLLIYVSINRIGLRTVQVKTEYSKLDRWIWYAFGRLLHFLLKQVTTAYKTRVYCSIHLYDLFFLWLEFIIHLLHFQSVFSLFIPKLFIYVHILLYINKYKCSIPNTYVFLWTVYVLSLLSKSLDKN